MKWFHGVIYSMIFYGLMEGSHLGTQDPVKMYERYGAM